MKISNCEIKMISLLIRYNEAILTAVESGLVKLWKYENPVELNPIDYEETYILKYLPVYKY